MVSIYTKFKETFSINKHRHYLLTPRELTRWVKGMLGYDLAAEELLDVFCYEAQRLIADRLVDQPSKTKFHAMLAKVGYNCTLHTPTHTPGHRIGTHA